MSSEPLELDLGLAAPEASRMTANDYPQARYEAHGPAALSDRELIALVLQGTQAVETAMASAGRILSEAGSLAALASWRPADFQRVGVTTLKAFQLSTLAEIGRRMMTPRTSEAAMMNRPELVQNFLSPLCVGLDVEKFWVLCLNRKNRLIKLVEVSSGTATAALAHPREVFRAAIRESATAIVCAHNHPSGDPSPSSADMHLTRQLREAAKAVDIELEDHVVIGRPSADPMGRGFYSFREAGIL